MGESKIDIKPASGKLGIMLVGLGALTLIQTVDWIRDAHQRGLGADSVKDLMVKPYRRIVVLHITILAGGFALAALDEPTAGLLILVLVKTGSDVWHWKQDSEAEEVPDPMSLLTPEAMAEMAEQYPEPKVTVNGEEKHFSSFAEMKRSKEFSAVMVAEVTTTPAARDQRQSCRMSAASTGACPSITSGRAAAMASTVGPATSY